MQEMEETQVQTLGGEDPLEEEIATHSSILAWETLWREEPGRLQSMGSQRVRFDWARTGWLARGDQKNFQQRNYAHYCNQTHIDGARCFYRI